MIAIEQPTLRGYILIISRGCIKMGSLVSCVDMRWKIARSLETQEPVSLDSALLK